MSDESILKNEVSLREVLGVYLKYTPSYAETEQLHSDLRTMNHTLLRDAILECEKAKKLPATALKGEKRKAFHEVYARKVKELAALYPLLFSVENALRSYAFEVYTEAFGSDFWWKIFLPTVPNDHSTKKKETDFPLGGKNNQFKFIRAVQVNPAFISQMLFCINESLTQKNLKLLCSDLAGSDDFYKSLTFSGISDLISSDFNLCPIGNLKKKDFSDHCTVLRKARNEIFHGNPIKDRKLVYTASERILDALNIHLGDFDEVLKNTSYTRFKPTIPRTGRHCAPPA